MIAELTDRERRELVGLSARDRELGRQIEELREDHSATLRLIERRVGLTGGAIGTTHALIDGTQIVAIAAGEVSDEDHS